MWMGPTIIRIAVTAAVLALIATLPSSLTALATDSSSGMSTPLGPLEEGCETQLGVPGSPQSAWTSDDRDPVRIQVIGPATYVAPDLLTVPSKQAIKFAIDGFDHSRVQVSASTTLHHEADVEWLTPVFRGGTPGIAEHGYHAGLSFPQPGCYRIDVRGLQDGDRKVFSFPVAVLEVNELANEEPEGQPTDDPSIR